jgi:hypothetical protein
LPARKEKREVVGQCFGERRTARDDAHAPVHTGREFAELGMDARHRREHLTSLAQQHLAGGGRPDAARATHPHRRADIGLDRGDALAHRRRDQRFARRRASDVALSQTATKRRSVTGRSGVSSMVLSGSRRPGDARLVP